MKSLTPGQAENGEKEAAGADGYGDALTIRS
jgi:hypothetical protein